jgi:hypothetical protein
MDNRGSKSVQLLICFASLKKVTVKEQRVDGSYYMCSFLQYKNIFNLFHFFLLRISIKFWYYHVIKVYSDNNR